MSYSILKHAKKENINLEYFPYIIINDALDDDIYNKLSNEYPSLDQIINSEKKKKDRTNNKRVNMNSINVENNNLISDNWKEFVKYHVSNEFWLEVLELFKDKILELHPNIEEKIGCKLDELNTHIRFSKKTEEKEMEMECQIAMNTPVTKTCSVRGTHVDFPDKLYVGLFYMRIDDDKSDGGDLEIYKIKDQKKFEQLKNTEKKYRMFSSNLVEKVKTIKYKKNCLVFFINCNHAVHAVTPRNPTNHNRRFVNFVGGLGSVKLF